MTLIHTSPHITTAIRELTERYIEPKPCKDMEPENYLNWLVDKYGKDRVDDYEQHRHAYCECCGEPGRDMTDGEVFCSNTGNWVTFEWQSFEEFEEMIGLEL